MGTIPQCTEWIAKIQKCHAEHAALSVRSYSDEHRQVESRRDALAVSRALGAQTFYGLDDDAAQVRPKMSYACHYFTDGPRLPSKKRRRSRRERRTLAKAVAPEDMIREAVAMLYMQGRLGELASILRKVL